MAYCTREEVRALLKTESLHQLVGEVMEEDPSRLEELIAPLIDEANADADGEINGYLAKRYAVPIAPVPKVINKFAKDIAVYNLFARKGVNEDSDEKTILNRYNAAIKYLTLVAQGTVELGISDPEAAARIGFTAQSNPRIFSRDTMKGW